MAQPKNLYQLIKPIEDEMAKIRKNMNCKGKWKEPYKAIYLYKEQLKEKQNETDLIINNYNLTK